MARGGWREGAGRPAVRGRIEDTPFIDADCWRRAGMLEPDGEGRCYAHRSRLPPIAYWTSAGAITVGIERGGGRRITERIGLACTPCHFGGMRTWFRCPACGARALRLYLADAGFRCRGCTPLSYPTQRDSQATRAMRKIGLFAAEGRPGPTW